MVHKYKTVIGRVLAILLFLGALTIWASCARKGLVAEKYPAEFYNVPKLLLPVERNPKFIVYGDNRPGWRFLEKFAKKKNWGTWKMLIFPFYELYWLGNGFVGGVNWLRHTPDYGIRERRMVRDAVYAEAHGTQVDFLLNTGDMPTDGRRPSHWETFLRENKVERSLLVDFPYLVVSGNHERTNDLEHGLPNYQAIFDYPLFYVLDFPDAVLFVVDSNVIIDQYQFIDDDVQEKLFQKWFISDDTEQPGWLERELAVRHKTFKMVALHHPPISFGKHHGNWTNPTFGENNSQKRRQLIKLFQEQDVQVVFCGHEHLYEHSIVTAHSNGDTNQSAVHFIISGGGGAPVRDATDAKKLSKFKANYRREEIDVRLIKQETVYNYCRVKVEPNELTTEVFEVTGDSAQPLKLIETILVKPKIFTPLKN